ncbi:response regulator [Streptomyces sp. 7N604]|uniref:response regulator n=1 Tax=Streptomyces sp. 7N604 TaxID=3457415 RepID=UPI003FD508E4
MPGVDGITAAQRILASRPSARVIALTTFDDDDHLYPALEAWACGFLVKDTPPGELVAAVRRAAEGESPFSRDVLRRLVEQAVQTAGLRASPPVPPSGRADERTSDEVVYRYPNKEMPAVDRVSLTLRRGEVVAIVGETMRCRGQASLQPAQAMCRRRSRRGPTASAVAQ